MRQPRFERGTFGSGGRRRATLTDADRRCVKQLARPVPVSTRQQRPRCYNNCYKARGSPPTEEVGGLLNRFPCAANRRKSRPLNRM